MKKTKDLAVLTIVFATLAALTSSIFAQHQDLPADGPDRPVLGELPHFPLEIYEKNPVGVTVETFLTGLDVVWGLEFAPDGRLFITEKAGRIRIVDADGRLDPTPWATVGILDEETRERGLFGLALHPNFYQEPWVYVMYTYDIDENWRGNRISRFREVNGRGSVEEIILDNIPGAVTHNGGRIKFGPDGMLYIGTGDARDRRRSQNIDNIAGSILRITPEGDVPTDNPWEGNPIWAYGFRNPTGIAFRNDDSALFVADHGPTVEWEPRIGAYDELNIIEKGANYGWPLVVGAPGDARYVDPILSWIPSVPPGDLIFHKGELFISALWSEALIRVQFNDSANPNRVTGVQRWFNERVWRDGILPESSFGRLRALAVGPDGALYLGTTNRDGRLEPRPNDDRVLRIVIDD
ncbi:MAG: PQQ-dependent sugar dehydrogenase [Candidatus Rariloculaceae bacterium]